MLIREFAEMFNDAYMQKYIIHDLDSGDDIFMGMFEEMDTTLANMEIDSVDTLFNPDTYLTINVEAGYTYE